MERRLIAASAPGVPSPNGFTRNSAPTKMDVPGCVEGEATVNFPDLSAEQFCALLKQAVPCIDIDPQVYGHAVIDNGDGTYTHTFTFQ